MMMLALLLAPAPAQNRLILPGGEDDGTRTIAAEPRCDPSGDEIVICRKTDSARFRLERIEPRYGETPVRAARSLGPGEVSLEAEQRAFPGATGPAAMVRLRIPLGRKSSK